MADDEINVEYDKTGVSTPNNTNVDGFSEELSEYLYPKLFGIPNVNDEGETEFDNNDIQEYNLNIVNNKIDISTTHKLINYLKAFAKKTLSNVDSTIRELDSKLDIDDYIIDEELKSDSSNPVENKAILSEFDTVKGLINAKANIEHYHEISNINNLDASLSSLSGRIDSKAEVSSLTSHVNNTNNPHNVTLSQLGLTDSGLDDFACVERAVSAEYAPRCQKYGKVVVFSFATEVFKKYPKSKTIFTLKEQFRPNIDVHGVGYLPDDKQVVTYEIKPDGRFWVDADIPKNHRVRVRDCYFTV